MINRIEEGKEYILSIDYKLVLIVLLLVITGTLSLVYIFSDTFIQDSIVNIRKEEKNIVKQRFIIKKATESISSSISNIEKATESISGSISNIEGIQGQLKEKSDIIFKSKYTDTNYNREHIEKIGTSSGEITN